MSICNMTKAEQWAEWCVPVLHAALGVAAWTSAGLVWAPVLLLAGATARLLGSKSDGITGALVLAGISCACFGV